MIETSPKIVTVTGPIEPERAGATLMHEHVLIDLSVLVPNPSTVCLCMEHLGEMAWSADALLTADNIDMSDADEATAELKLFAAAGGVTIVDQTPIGMRRDISQLLEISQHSGVQIVVGSAFWVDLGIPEPYRVPDVDLLASAILGEFRDGIAGTEIRPGVIGEVGTSSPITELERASLLAAVVAQHETGASVHVHLDPWGREGVAVCEILKEAGADMERVVIGHLNPSLEDLGYQREIGASGATLGYDLFGYGICNGPGSFPPRDIESVRAVAELVSDGLSDQLVVSHDVSLKTNYVKYGGWGYAHLLTRVVPLMVDAGISQDEIDTMLVHNPRRLLTF